MFFYFCSIFLASSQTVPYPLSRFDIHPHVRVGTFENKMATCEGRCSTSTSTILRKNRRCEQSTQVSNALSSCIHQCTCITCMSNTHLTLHKSVYTEACGPKGKAHLQAFVHTAV